MGDVLLTQIITNSILNICSSLFLSLLTHSTLNPEGRTRLGERELRMDLYKRDTFGEHSLISSQLSLYSL